MSPLVAITKAEQMKSHNTNVPAAVACFNLNVKIKEFWLNYTQWYARFGTGSSEKNVRTTNVSAYYISTYKQDIRCLRIYSLSIFQSIN